MGAVLVDEWEYIADGSLGPLPRLVVSATERAAMMAMGMMTAAARMISRAAKVVAPARDERVVVRRGGK